jgi:hypothetical protein
MKSPITPIKNHILTKVDYEDIQNVRLKIDLDDKNTILFRDPKHKIQESVLENHSDFPKLCDIADTIQRELETRLLIPETENIVVGFKSSEVTISNRYSLTNGFEEHIQKQLASRWSDISESGLQQANSITMEWVQHIDIVTVNIRRQNGRMMRLRSNRGCTLDTTSRKRIESLRYTTDCSDAVDEIFQYTIQLKDKQLQLDTTTTYPFFQDFSDPDVQVSKL